MKRTHLILGFILITHAAQCVRFNFNKLNCNASDPSVIIEKCLLKAFARNRQFISIKAKLMKPVNTIKVRFQFMKRANGWKPFMYDFTVDCSFLKKTSPVNKLLWSTVKDITNINHSCPFDKTIELYRVENSYVSSKMLMNLPVPTGEYGLFTKFILNNKTLVFVNFYGVIF